jgi:hypothetical protein
MANWLQKFQPPAKARNLPAQRPAGSLTPMTSRAPAPDSLPNASVIYGIAASTLFVLAIYFLVTGVWVKGLLILLPAACLLGFAVYFLKVK